MAEQLSQEKILDYNLRLFRARTRILKYHGFYGILLSQVEIALSSSFQNAGTDGDKIYFSPGFMDTLSDKELEFVLIHEILHLVLKHVCRQKESFDDELFNLACDIVVNSNILLSNNMDIDSITLQEYGVSVHLTPDGEEGYKFTAEQVYRMLKNEQKKHNDEKNIGKSGTGEDRDTNNESNCQKWDDHSKWDDFSDEEKKEYSNEWSLKLCNAYEAMNDVGSIPAFAQRALNEMMRPQTDWRTVLNEFVQEEINDYSFLPPDKRFQDDDFFLPDFNAPEESVKDVLFFIDTSGSMSTSEITTVFSEVKGAIDQYDGKLKGWLGFFDAKVVPPIPFSDKEELLQIIPTGSGGTNFDIIFDYVRDNIYEIEPSIIIIMTDGCANFPDESAAMDIPVLWLITNEVIDPPWGRVARVIIDESEDY